jgi:2,3-bisphosphoglycerate-dependent phosphoglycerate mutase
MPSAHLPHPLSARGRRESAQGAEAILQQAEALGLTIDEQIESSQLLRAHETAQVLAETLSRRLDRPFRVQDWPDLLERSLGSCANLSFSQIERVLALDARLDPLPFDWRRRAYFRLPVPGAESHMQAGERTAARIRERVEFVRDHAEIDTLKILVAHGGCIRHACVHLGVLDVDVVSTLTMGYAESVVIEPRSDDEWVQVAGEWRKRLPSAAASGVDAAMEPTD